MSQFSFFQDTKSWQLTKDCRRLLLSTSLPLKFLTLSKYFTATSIEYSQKSLAKLTSLVEAQLTEQLLKLSCLYYQIIILSNEWGHAGESQVKASFGRCLLRLSVSETWTYEHQREFDDLFSSYLERYQFSGKPLDYLQNQFNSYEINIFGETIKYNQFERVNELLQWVSSRYVYFSGQAGGRKSFFYGEGKRHKIGDYLVLILEKEIARHPTVIMQLAAVTGNKTTLIRTEALQSIVYQKWLPVAENNYMYRSMISSDIAWNISMAVKQHTLELFGVTSASQLMAISDVFTSDMKETVLHHELGHCVMEDMILTPEQVAQGKGTEVVKETIYASLLEFFADFAPKRGKMWGAMHNMCHIAAKDSNRATRMFYMYLSDVWFYDTPDEYMYLYSDLMLMVLTRYIRLDRSIDFDLMVSDLVIDPQRADRDQLTPLERLYEIYTWDVMEIKSIIENATYELVSSCKYPKLKQVVMGVYKSNNPYLDDASSMFLNSYWMNMVNYVLRISDSEDKMRTYLEESEEKTIKKVMILSCGRKKAEAYNFDHRAYIFDKMIELGIVADKEAAKRFYKGTKKVPLQLKA